MSRSPQQDTEMETTFTQLSLLHLATALINLLTSGRGILSCRRLYSLVLLRAQASMENLGIHPPQMMGPENCRMGSCTPIGEGEQLDM